eukprot:7385731-Prymnesium_polylepis.2
MVLITPLAGPAASRALATFSWRFWAASLFARRRRSARPLAITAAKRVVTLGSVERVRGICVRLRLRLGQECAAEGSRPERLSWTDVESWAIWLARCTSWYIRTEREVTRRHAR